MHNTLQDVVSTITLESEAHVQREVSRLFPSHTRRIDILITRDNFQTLMDVVFANSIRTNMVQRASTTITHATMMATQKKTRSYTKQTPNDDFIPLAIET
jgi:glucose-6-phosphate 1-dehydrogenase